MAVARRPAIARALLSAAAGLALSGVASADGKYWPEAAYEKDVRIPSQRALIRFKDGKEALIIESAAESDSKGLGWVIPLPGVPEKMEVARPGLFESLSFRLGARITHDRWPEVRAAGFVFALVLFALVVLALKKTLFSMLVYVLVMLVLAGMLLPAMAGGGRRAALGATGVELVVERRVGSYDVTVLRAGTRRALGNWLEANGFAGLDAEEEAVVADYIAKKWCFFAAKLAREEGGRASPHPIAFEFASTEAIYPLSLTGLAGSEPHFDIFVIGERRAVVPGLDTKLCDRFEWKKGQKGWRSHGNLWTAQNVDVAIGHPDLKALMWDGCVLTRLTGTLTPGQMAEDVTIGWEEARPHRDHFYSTLGAWYTGVLVFFALGGVCLVVTCIVRRRDFDRGGSRVRALLALLVVLLGSALVGLVVFAVLPKRSVTSGRFPWYVDRNRGETLTVVAHEAFEDSKPKDAAELRKVVERTIKDESWDMTGSPYLGGETREEASPGNYEICEEDGELRVYYYDRFARRTLSWPPPRRRSPQSP